MVAVLSSLSITPVEDVLEAKGCAVVRILAVPNTSRKNTYNGVHTGSVPNEASSGSGSSSDKSDDVGRTNINTNVRISVKIDRICKARRNACTFRQICGDFCVPVARMKERKRTRVSVSIYIGKRSRIGRDKK